VSIAAKLLVSRSTTGPAGSPPAALTTTKRSSASAASAPKRSDGPLKSSAATKADTYACVVLERQGVGGFFDRLQDALEREVFPRQVRQDPEHLGRKPDPCPRSLTNLFAPIVRARRWRYGGAFARVASRLVLPRTAMALFFPVLVSVT
jgi:hypothetical protein